MARSRTGSSARGGPSSAGAGGASGTGALLKFRNRALTVMRGITYNQYGDPSDVGTVLYMNLQASVAETTEAVFDPATQRQQIIRGITAVVPAWADLEDTDTIRDPATGNYYMIESIEARPGIGYYPPDLLLTLRMRSGVSTSSD